MDKIALAGINSFASGSPYSELCENPNPLLNCIKLHKTLSSKKAKAHFINHNYPKCHQSQLKKQEKMGPAQVFAAPELENSMQE